MLIVVLVLIFDLDQTARAAVARPNVGPAWGWAQNTPFRRNKSGVNEGGISTPFIVRWPGHVKPNTQTGQLGHIIDVLPTCLELAGGKPLATINGVSTQPLESRSLAPIFRGETRPSPEELCWEWSGHCAIRRGKWKLVWDTAAKPSSWALCDMEADRTELNNLAARMPEKAGELKAAYERWAKATNRMIPRASLP